MKTTLRLLVPIALLLLGGQSAIAQSAYGLQIPVRGGTSEVKEPAAVEIVESEDGGLPVVSAATNSDAANAANDHIQELDTGVSLFATKDGGLGMMAIGSGFYQQGAENSDVVRLSRRKAYVIAYFQAKKNLAETLEGASVEAQTQILGVQTNATSDEGSASATAESVEEETASRISARLQGVEIFEVQDKGGEVKVTVYCTPKSASAAATSGTRGVVAKDLVAAIDRIMDEAVNGFVPPIGARTVHCPETEQYAFISYGSALVRSSKTPRGQALNLKQATLAAKLRADRALVARLTGQEIDYKATLKDSTVEIYQEWDRQTPAPDAEADTPLAGAESAFVNVLSTTEEGKSVTKGMKPPGVQTKSYHDTKTGWVTTVHIWIPASDELLDAIRKARPSGPGGSGGKDDGPYDPDERGPSGRVGDDPRCG